MLRGYGRGLMLRALGGGWDVEEDVGEGRTIQTLDFMDSARGAEFLREAGFACHFWLELCVFGWGADLGVC